MKERNHQRRNQLHHAHACAQTTVQTQRAALLLFRKRKADVRHTTGKVRAGKTTTRNNNERS